MQEYRESLLNPELLGMLDAHAKQPALPSLAGAGPAGRGTPLRNWTRGTNHGKGAKKFHQNAGTAAHANAVKWRDLGHQFASKIRLEEFDATEARAIATFRRAVDEFSTNSAASSTLEMYAPPLFAHGQFSQNALPPEFKPISTACKYLRSAVK